MTELEEYKEKLKQLVYIEYPSIIIITDLGKEYKISIDEQIKLRSILEYGRFNNDPLNLTFKEVTEIYNKIKNIEGKK